MMNISERKSNKIDVLIPCHEKDLDTLPLCLRSLRECVLDDIDEVFVVSSDNDSVRGICDEFGCKFVDEVSYMGFSPNDLVSLDVKVRGWLFQQLIKLSGNIGKNDNYLVLDADVMFVKPYRFLNDDLTPNFIMIPFDTFESFSVMNERLIGYSKKRKGDTFVSDKMLFNVDVVQEIHRKIEEYTGEKSWIDAIVKNFDKNISMGFSEFELYGTYYGDRPHTESIPLERRYSKECIKSYEELRHKFRKLGAVTFYA